MNWLLDHKLEVQKISLALAMLALAVVIGLLYSDIQQSRLQACMDQNVRHRATVTVLRQLTATAEAGESPAQRKNTRAALQSSLLVIDALAPAQNCAVVVSH